MTTRRPPHAAPSPIRVTVSPRTILVSLPTGSTGVLHAAADRPLALAHAIGAVHSREFFVDHEWQRDYEHRTKGRGLPVNMLPAPTAAPDWGDDEGDNDVLARCGTRAGEVCS